MVTSGLVSAKWTKGYALTSAARAAARRASSGLEEPAALSAPPRVRPGVLVVNFEGTAAEVVVGCVLDPTVRPGVEKLS